MPPRRASFFSPWRSASFGSAASRRGQRLLLLAILEHFRRYVRVELYGAAARKVFHTCRRRVLEDGLFLAGALVTTWKTMPPS